MFNVHGLLHEIDVNELLIYVTAAGCGPVIPVSTFMLAGVSVRPVYVSGRYGNLVWDGDEYYFYFGWARTNLTERWWALSSQYS